MGRYGGNRGRGGSRGAKRGRMGNGRRDRKAEGDDGQVEYKSYPKIETNNENLKAYYKMHPQMIPEDEFDAFYSTLQKPLPAAFRITGGKEKAHCLKKMIEEEYFPSIKDFKSEDADGVVYGQPKTMPWYPDGRAYHIDWPKQIIRKHAELKRFHEFLVNCDQVGSISRQEAVSMIPPVVLNVQKGDVVLDMCASPGSKTKQLIEMVTGTDVDPKLVGVNKERNAELPDGMVVANDFDPRRCYLLVHQASALDSPALVVTNHNGMSFPNIYKPNADGNGPDKSKPILFDRVLCDVPCSGDGTARKNIQVWQRWSPMDGPNQHHLQKRILTRGAELLAVGGELVYSTCSMQPAENEAVIQSLLNDHPGAFELVDVVDRVPGLIHKKGITDWVMQGKVGREWVTYAKFADLPEGDLRKKLPESCFPAENIKELNMDRCIRIFPHLQNTGGFFVACLRKVKPLSKTDAPQTEAEEKALQRNAEESSVEKPSHDKLSKFQKDAYPNDPYYQIAEDSPALKSIRTFYALDESFPQENLFYRKNDFDSANTTNARYYHLATNKLRETLVANPNLRIVSAGLKMLERSRHNKSLATNDIHGYRVVQCGTDIFAPFVNKRLLHFGFENTKRLLSRRVTMVHEFTEDVKRQHKENGEVGPCMVVFNPKANEENAANSKTSSVLLMSCFLSPTNCTIMVNKYDAHQMLLLLVGPDEANKLEEECQKAAAEKQITTHAEKLARAQKEKEEAAATKAKLEANATLLGQNLAAQAEALEVQLDAGSETTREKRPLEAKPERVEVEIEDE